MKVFLTGGTGFVGKFLSTELIQRGHEITILTRRVPSRPPAAGISYVQGDPTQPGDWMGVVPDHDWIINLAGASVFTRWTAAHKKLMYDSRILTTRHLVQALRPGGGQTLFSTSAIGYYGLCGDEVLTEDAPPGTDFLGKLAQDWEGEALKARERGARVVITRFGIVLGKGGGILDQLVPVFKAGLGGPVGSGQQWFSWIDQTDQLRAFLFVLEHPDLTGPLNFTAPNPVRNRELARALGKVLHRPSFMPAPGFLVKLLMGEFGQVILGGQRVIPGKLLAAGFDFQFPTIAQSLAHQLGGSSSLQ